MRQGDIYYEVTIKRVEAVEERDREWKQVADSGNLKDGGPVYDYAYAPIVRQRERVILQQQVDQLDVNAVVLAVLGILPGPQDSRL
jgi:hypothetical protein